MGIERSLSSGSQSEAGEVLVETQKWLNQHSRDILDESDEIFSVQFELVYTMGAQRPMEFSPKRWNILMSILAMAQGCLDDQELHQAFPYGFQPSDVDPGEFPRVQILEAAAGKRLMEMLAQKICGGELSDLPVWRYPPKVRSQLYRYLTDVRIKHESAVPELYVSFDTDHGRSTLLLLRGLIADRILCHILTDKRWRVNYGLDLSRTMLAVPYLAKGLPALRAEFSHPEVTIGLTCLSYYYGGLSDAQLSLCFDNLLREDNAQAEYDSWIRDVSDLPNAFQTLADVNLMDNVQCSEELFPRIRATKNVVDFYLSHLVFPKQLKGFLSKLSSPGWDIARSKNHPTTGFSGTNDSRYILPLSAAQADLEGQLHTNATVLDCILYSANTYEVIPPHGGLNAFLEKIVRATPPVRVILDVGALVLQWRNYEMADECLSRAPVSSALAVVFSTIRTNSLC